MIVASQQPEHLPWMGLINKISKADIFVILDSVQYEDSNVQNRNRIRTATGWQWLTIPVAGSKMKLIKDMQFSGEKYWKHHYLSAIENNYQKSLYFQKFYPEFKSIIYKATNDLTQLNIDILMWMLQKFNIPLPKIVRASALNIDATLKKTDMVIDMVKKAGGDTFLSGLGAKTYLDQTKFDSAGLNLEFNSFDPPVYEQQYDPFIPNMSAIDYLFNSGGVLPYSDHTDKGMESLRILLNKIKFKSSWSILEVFGGDGTGHSRAYAPKAREIELWELDPEKCNKLHQVYPWANIKNVDTFEEIKTCDSTYDLVLFDAPSDVSYEGLVPYALKTVKPGGWAIIRIIKRTHTPNDSIIPFDGVKNIEESNYKILNKKMQVREFYGFNDWTYHYAYQIGETK